MAGGPKDFNLHSITETVSDDTIYVWTYVRQPEKRGGKSHIFYFSYERSRTTISENNHFHLNLHGLRNQAF